MNKKFKYKWLVLVSSTILAFCGFGIRGNADSVSTNTNGDSATVAQVNNNQSSYALYDSSTTQDGSVEGNTTMKSSDGENKVTTHWDSVESGSSSSSASDSSSSANTSSGDGTATSYGDATGNNVDQNSSSTNSGSTTDGASASSSSANASSNSSQPMLGMGDKGSAAAGSGLDNIIKPVIDKIVPGGGLDNTKPNVSSSSSSQTDGSTTAPANSQPDSAAAGQSQVNSAAESAGAVANQQTVRTPNQSVIEQSQAKTIQKNSFANRVSKSDPNNTQKNTTKLVGFTTFSNLFYKQVLNKKKDPGKFTTTNGKKVTITTPVSSVKYTEHDVSGFAESLPVIISLAIIGIVGLSFIIFDPLRFIFR